MAASKDAKEANFRGWHFPKDPDDSRGFGETVFASAADFSGATFSSNTSFGGATFIDVALFNDAMFGGKTTFQGATFSGHVWFEDARFRDDVFFDDTKFGRGVSIEGARFSEAVDFTRAVCSPGATVDFSLPHGRWRPFRHRCGGELAYRFAKQSAQAAGDYSEAGRYHYAEQCAIEDDLWVGLRPRLPAFWLWLVRIVFGRIVFGYGEKPHHPLLLGLGVIILWTALYAGLAAIAPTNETAAAAIQPHSPSVREALYFSLATFTSLAYGDFQPKPAYRLLAVSEAILGAALMAVFIVCLTRKYMR